MKDDICPGCGQILCECRAYMKRKVGRPKKELDDNDDRFKMDTWTQRQRQIAKEAGAHRDIIFGDCPDETF